MNQEEIGKFIAECRREKHLTQAQLAERLNLTDRAVSKWETGKSMPDSSVMLELCEILGITVNELLSGEKISGDAYGEKADEILVELTKKGENSIRINGIVAILFSVSLLIGILVCAICDIAISGGFTWALIPISSMLLAWVVSIPVILLGRRGIGGGLFFLSVFIFPYLYLLGKLIGEASVFTVGAAMSGISLAYLWLIWFLFRLLRSRKLLAAAITCLLASSFTLSVKVVLVRMISETYIDVWDFLSMFLFLIMAFTFFVWDYAKRKGFLR